MFSSAEKHWCQRLQIGFEMDVFQSEVMQEARLVILVYNPISPNDHPLDRLILSLSVT
jgi:hypothetical protein